MNLWFLLLLIFVFLGGGIFGLGYLAFAADSVWAAFFCGVLTCFMIVTITNMIDWINDALANWAANRHMSAAQDNQAQLNQQFKAMADLATAQRRMVLTQKTLVAGGEELEEPAVVEIGDIRGTDISE